MTLLRTILAVVVGYLILAGVAVGIVGTLFGDNVPEPDRGAIIFAFGGLVIGAIVAGFLCTLIAGSANHPAVYITIGIVIVLAARNLITGAGIEPDWYRVTSTLALAIGFLVGGSAAAYRLQG